MERDQTVGSRNLAFSRFNDSRGMPLLTVRNFGFPGRFRKVAVAVGGLGQVQVDLPIQSVAVQWDLAV